MPCQLTNLLVCILCPAAVCSNRMYRMLSTYRVFVRSTAPPLVPAPATAGGSSGGGGAAAAARGSSNNISSSSDAPEVVTLGSSDGERWAGGCQLFLFTFRLGHA